MTGQQQGFSGGGSSRRRLRPQGGSPSPCSPGSPDPAAAAVAYSTSQRRVKGEDVAFLRQGVCRCRGGPVWSFFCICDGHHGAGASKFVRRHLWSVLGPLLPRMAPPSCASEDFPKFAETVSTAVIDAFAEIGEQFALTTVSGPTTSGTTVTLALLCGRLLTVANLGDSEAVLDAGSDPILATVSHRLDANGAERRRLAEAGVVLAPQNSTPSPRGPLDLSHETLRCWPGGLAFSRSIGDAGAGRPIVSLPHVFQAVLPKRKARLVMASDGLWDMIKWDKAAKMIRDVPIALAASKVVSGALMHHNGPIVDDTTVIVLDIAAPPDDTPDSLEECSVPVRACPKKEKNFGKAFSSCLFGYTDVLDVGRRTPKLEKDPLRVLARIDALDLVKSSVNDASSNLRRAASACLPPTAEQEERMKASSAPAHWAPAFLSAQRAHLGTRSAGNRPEVARTRGAQKAHSRRRRRVHKASMAEDEKAKLVGLFY